VREKTAFLARKINAFLGHYRSMKLPDLFAGGRIPQPQGVIAMR
jgi:hypothetical protein